MKKILFASVAILAAFISTQAQSSDIAYNDTKPAKEERKELRQEKKESRIALRMLEGNEINYQSKEEFYRTFGSQENVTWIKGKFYDEATFDNDGVITTAYFDFEANLVGTTCIKTFADLPASAQSHINKLYKDFTVDKVIFFDDNEDVDTNMIMYGNQFDDEDNYFVELRKDDQKVVVQVTSDGQVGYFTSLDK